MTLEEIKINREVLNRYERILEIFKRRMSREETDIQAAYLEYIRLAIVFGTNNPKFHEYNDIIGNCYTHALDIYGTERIFPSPSIYVGILSGYKGECKTASELLERFYADCKILGIEVYDTQIDKENIHGGYKIAIYFGKRIWYNDYDFHFLRENNDRTWSEQKGYGGDIVMFDGLPPKSIDREFSYELIKVVEIVKPIIRERK